MARDDFKVNFKLPLILGCIPLMIGIYYLLKYGDANDIGMVHLVLGMFYISPSIVSFVASRIRARIDAIEDKTGKRFNRKQVEWVHKKWFTNPPGRVRAAVLKTCMRVTSTFQITQVRNLGKFHATYSPKNYDAWLFEAAEAELSRRNNNKREDR